MLVSYFILFQAQAVANKQVDLPPALEELFYKVDDFVKALPLLFIQISTVLGLQKRMLTNIRAMSWQKLFSHALISLSYSNLQFFARQFDFLADWHFSFA